MYPVENDKTEGEKGTFYPLTFGDLGGNICKLSARAGGETDPKEKLGNLKKVLDKSWKIC